MLKKFYSNSVNVNQVEHLLFLELNQHIFVGEIEESKIFFKVFWRILYDWLFLDQT